MTESLASNPSLLFLVALLFGLVVVAGWITQSGETPKSQRRQRAGMGRGEFVSARPEGA